MPEKNRFLKLIKAIFKPYEIISENQELIKKNIELDNKYEKTSDKLSNLALEFMDMETKLKNKDKEFESIQDGFNSLIGKNTELLKKIIENSLTFENAKQIYCVLAADYDKEGFNLYNVVKNTLGFGACEKYYAEDCVGRFEEMNGFTLKDYSEAVRFGIRSYREDGNYEFVENYSIDRTTPEYKEYQKLLWGNAVNEVLKHSENFDCEKIPNTLDKLFKLQVMGNVPEIEDFINQHEKDGIVWLLTPITENENHLEDYEDEIEL